MFPEEWMHKEIYSICFMCTMRCPIRVEVQNDAVTLIAPNPHAVGAESGLCPKGAAGPALLNDSQRLQYPMIRTGPRGSGKWKRATWTQALDYVAVKLKKIIKQYGAESFVLGERWQLSTHVSRAFSRALGSPNHFTHDSLCKGSVNTACRSLFGYTDEEMGMDYRNTKHIVLYGRNIFETFNPLEVRQLGLALEEGARLTCIDPRVTVTAAKAHRYWMIRPGTDLALNYALIHTILKERLYDQKFVGRWVSGLRALEAFVRPYTPEWAEKECGIPAVEIVSLAREISHDMPRVIFHFGYRGTNFANETYFRRSIMMLNCLMGSIETKGGFFFTKGPAEVHGQSPRELTDQLFPKIAIPRFDRVGTADFPLPDPLNGVAQMLPGAILEENPYPIKGALFFRFDPLTSLTDTQRTYKALDKLDLIVTIDINHSETAGYSDVVLPESLYLERMDSVFQVNGLVPEIFFRRPAVTPRYDTKSGPMILKELAKRMGIGHYFPYKSVAELVDWQLVGTGFSMEDFNAKGFVSYTKKEIYWDREDGLKLKTPSGMIEFTSSLLENAGFESFPAYDAVSPPDEGMFRLICGRVAVHTHGSTQNNLYLNEILPENALWMNPFAADCLGIRNGDEVMVSSSQGAGKIKVLITDLIHREAVFMLHGFGNKNALAARSFNRGLSDAILQKSVTDMVGGSQALYETFVTVRPV